MIPVQIKNLKILSTIARTFWSYNQSYRFEITWTGMFGRPCSLRFNRRVEAETFVLKMQEAKIPFQILDSRGIPVE